MGHLIIAQYMATRSDCREVHLIVSPQNPLKQPADLADEVHRLEMTRLGVRSNALLKASRVEFGLPRPSYTIDTLRYLADRHPGRRYKLIIGSDNLAIFHKWRSWESILDDFGCNVYLRPGYPLGQLGSHPGVSVFEAPLLDISATYIRQRLAENVSIRYLVPTNVERYIEQNDVFGFLR